MIREKIQRNHKVEACQIIFAYWRKNERRVGNNEHYRSSGYLEITTPRE